MTEHNNSRPSSALWTKAPPMATFIILVAGGVLIIVGTLTIVNMDMIVDSWFAHSSTPSTLHAADR